MQLILLIDLYIINELSRNHNLTLNSRKSFVMLFGNINHVNTLTTNMNINLADVRLPIVNFAKKLGVILETDCRYRQHVKSLLQKAFLSLKLIYTSRQILNFKLKKTLCESLVLAHFNYCDFIYGPCLDQNDKNRIQKMPNSCCRLIFGLRKYDHISYTVKTLNRLSMKNRRALHLGSFAMKLINGQDTYTPLKRKLVPRSDIHTLNMRNIHKLTMPNHKRAIEI